MMQVEMFGEEFMSRKSQVAGPGRSAWLENLLFLELLDLLLH